MDLTSSATSTNLAAQHSKLLHNISQARVSLTTSVKAEEQKIGEKNNNYIRYGKMEIVNAN
jgi:hypothetical protein